MQISIAQEMQNIPEFRKFEFYTAYTEGWGLYAERVMREHCRQSMELQLAHLTMTALES